MKTKIIIIYCSVILIVIAFNWLIFSKKTEPAQAIQDSNSNASAVVNPPPIQQVQVEAQRVEPNPIVPSHIEQISQTNISDHREQFLTFIGNKNAPIDFFGKVVDQDGNPLEGAKIKAQAREWYVTPTFGVDARFPSVDKVSDTAGRFEIQGIKGDAPTIESLERDGYDPEPSAFHVYGTSIGSLNDPMIFKMWKTNIHEQLIVGEKRFHIAIDGQPHFIDLTKGTISESGEGDLKVWIKYPAETTADQTNNWLFEIDAINGGLLEEHDPNSSMYLAPENGYTPTFQHNRKLIRSGQRGTTGLRRFYVMLKNGQEYGRFTIQIIAPYNDKIPGMIDIQYAINPSGSRILR
jgi:hypothetical protein